jgi:hypothetical protein
VSRDTEEAAMGLWTEVGRAVRAGSGNDRMVSDTV